MSRPTSNEPAVPLKSIDRVELFFHRIRSKKFFASVIIIAVVAGGIGGFTDAISRISDLLASMSMSRKERALRELRKEGISYSDESLRSTAASGDAGTVSLLLQAQLSPNTSDTRGWTPLLWASFEGHLDVVDALLAAGAQPDLEDIGGQTPLMEAAAACHPNVAARLVHAGASLKGIQGTTALFWAAQNGCDEVIEVLCKHRINVNARLTGAWTPLMAAAGSGHLSAVRILLRAGALPDLTNKRGKTAEDLALANGYPVISQLLHTQEGSIQ